LNAYFVSDPGDNNEQTQIVVSLEYSREAKYVYECLTEWSYYLLSWGEMRKRGLGKEIQEFDFGDSQ
jgi:hypothetical protein